MKAYSLIVSAAVLLGLTCMKASADEGMWMIQDINEALEKNMKARGLKLEANEIYNADAPGASVSDAVVSLGFYCTGSVISDKGLILTNHHYANSNIDNHTTPEHNYLEEGFWAMNQDQEIPVEGEKVYFLKRVIDVTDEVKSLAKSLQEKGEPFGDRKLGALMERKYGETTGLECIMSSMWSGEKYCMSVYKVYTDLRLVAAPPVCIGYFGAEDDNWQWPRHNCDFAIYRIYEDGIPVTKERHLKISTAGYVPGSFAMVIGYPGATHRYTSSGEIDHELKVTLPISNRIRGGQISIIRKWMEADPEIRLKYSNWFFGLSNVQENNVGMEKAFRRFAVKSEKIAQEREMQKWIDSASNRKEMWGTLIPDLINAYSESREIERDKTCFRETLVRGSFIIRYLLRAGNAKTLEAAKKALLDGCRDTDSRVEKDLLAYSLEVYFSSLDDWYFGRFQQKMQDRFGENYAAMAEYLWDNSLVANPERIDAVTDMEEIERDPLRRFLAETSIMKFNERNGQSEKWSKVQSLEREYKRALYWTRLHKDVPQYPDANSTMRITYGTVGALLPSDGILYSYVTTTDGILEKYDPDNHSYALNSRQKSLLEKKKWGKWGADVQGYGRIMPVDFLTDNDITGGNSGSPVLNANGNLIGLAFDGNLESLASDASYTEFYNKCINTDIRFVMWVLDKYAGMKHILKELDFAAD